MKNKISFAELMQQNGFQHMGKTTYDGGFIYEREWRKTTDLAWYGEKESTYRIEGYESYGTPIIRLYENDRPLGMRDYSSPRCRIKIFEFVAAVAKRLGIPTGIPTLRASTPSARSSAAPGIPCERRHSNEQAI